MDEFEDLYPKAIKVLEEGLEDSLQFYNYEKIDHRKISSTNMIERPGKGGEIQLADGLKEIAKHEAIYEYYFK